MTVYPYIPDLIRGVQGGCRFRRRRCPSWSHCYRLLFMSEVCVLHRLVLFWPWTFSTVFEILVLFFAYLWPDSHQTFVRVFSYTTTHRHHKFVIAACRVLKLVHLDLDFHFGLISMRPKLWPRHISNTHILDRVSSIQRSSFTFIDRLGAMDLPAVLLNTCCE